jgi:hypothetical protein
MPVRSKLAFRAVLIVALALVVAAMVLPFHLVEELLRKFGWMHEPLDFLDTVAPGLEASHLISFAALGFLARFGWPRSRPRNVAIVILAVAVLVEFVQIWVPGREAALSHAVLEALGGLLGFAVAWLLTFAWGSSSLPEEFQASTHWSGSQQDH